MARFRPADAGDETDLSHFPALRGPFVVVRD